MQVRFECDDTEAAKLGEAAVQRLSVATRRLARFVRHASVRLTNMRAAGGLNKCCRIEFATLAAHPVAITSRGRDWRSAIGLALPRAERVLLRAWRAHARPQAHRFTRRMEHRH